MYNEKLEALITAALADGVLTDKEKEILFKKAESMGIDRDEFELVLDGRLAKRKKEMESQASQAAKPAQKENGIPQELDNLIKEYLADGIISAKEREVLLRKAQQLGLDVEEFDLYIDAQQQKADQVVATVMNQRKGNTCPYCGAPIPLLVDKCPSCDQFITPESSKDLDEIFNHLEDALVKFKSCDNTAENQAEVERYVRKAKMYYGNNPKVKILLQEVEKEIQEANEREEVSIEREEESKRKAWNVVKLEVIVAAIAIIFCIKGSYAAEDDDETFLWVIALIYVIIGFAILITTTIKKFCLKK